MEEERIKREEEADQMQIGNIKRTMGSSGCHNKHDNITDENQTMFIY
jgi:hypothetical protein